MVGVGSLALLGALLAAPAGAQVAPGDPEPRGRLVVDPFDGRVAQVIRLSDGNREQDLGVDGPLAVSADGSAIAYVGGYDVGGTEIRVRHADGADTAAGRVPGYVYAGAADFSGDGSQLAVHVQDAEDGASTLYVLVADGAAPPRSVITDRGDNLLISGVSFNPVADQLAFVRSARIGLISTAGGAVTDFSGGCAWPGQEPDCPPELETGYWSDGPVDFDPTGNRIVTQTSRHLFEEERTEVFHSVVGRGTRGLTRLGDVPVDDGSFNVGYAVFSPGGDEVAYPLETDPDGSLPPTVYVEPASGGTRTAVGSGQVVAWQACPDGVCAEYGDVPATPTTISLNYSTGDKVRLNGQVDPSAAGLPVAFTLEVQRGRRWVQVATKSARLSALSRYVVKLPRQDVFLCRATARFDGSAELEPSTTTKSFSC